MKQFTLQILYLSIFISLTLAGTYERYKGDLIGIQANFYPKEQKYCLYSQNQEIFQTYYKFMLEGTTNLMEQSDFLRCNEYLPIINGNCRFNGWTQVYYQQDASQPFYQSYFGQQFPGFIMARKSKLTSSDRNQIDGLLLVANDSTTDTDEFTKIYKQIVQKPLNQQVKCKDLIGSSWIAKVLQSPIDNQYRNCLYNGTFEASGTDNDFEFLGFGNESFYASYQYSDENKCPKLRVSYQGKCDNEKNTINITNQKEPAQSFFSENLVIIQTEQTLVYLVRE